MKARRLPAILVIGGLLVAALLTDGADDVDDGAAPAFGRDEPFRDAGGGAGIGAHLDLVLPGGQRQR